MLHFSPAGLIVNDDTYPWTLPCPTGVISDLNIDSPAMHWPFFSPTGGIVNGHCGHRIPTSPPGSDSSSSSSRSSFDPFDNFAYPFQYTDHGTPATNPDKTTNQGESPSLVNMNHSTGDAPASPSSSWDATDVNSNLSAIKMIQRVTTAEEVDVAVSAISTWANGLSWPVKEAHLISFRLAAARLFTDAWDPLCGKLFLNFDEKDVFVIKKYLPLTYLDCDQMQRLANTTRGSLVALLYGKLLEVNVLTSADVVVACELLLGHHQKHGYMQGLWELLSFAGDKVCRKATLRRMLTIKEELTKVKRNSNLYEVEHYADLIIQLIGDFVVIQAEKTKAALPKVKKVQKQKRRPRLRKVSEEQRRYVRQLACSELMV